MVRCLPMTIIGVVLASCSASTGILPAGPDTYAVTTKFAPIRGGSLSAQPAALAEAQAFCQSKGRVFIATQMGETAARRMGFDRLPDCVQMCTS
jgi:hypothetical protein